MGCQSIQLKIELCVDSKRIFNFKNFMEKWERKSEDWEYSGKSWNCYEILERAYLGILIKFLSTRTIVEPWEKRKIYIDEYSALTEGCGINDNLLVNSI